MIVVKRNGAEVDFNLQKIICAIEKALLEIDGNLMHNSLADRIAGEVNHYLNEHSVECITVEDIQELVESALMRSNRPDVAKAYIRYRHKHQMAREQYNSMMEAVKEKLQADNVQNQNANVDEKSFGGRIGETADLILKKYALDYCVSEKARKNHETNRIYIHDLNSYAVGSHNCLSLPFDDLLANGFTTRQTDVRPAQTLNTAFQLIAVIFQLQSLNQFGGVSATHLDWTMVPYVRKSFYKHYKDGIKFLEKRELDYSFHNGLSIEDDSYKAYSESAYNYAIEMTERECKQAVEAMYHNLNTLQSRSGNQLKWMAG